MGDVVSEIHDAGDGPALIGVADGSMYGRPDKAGPFSDAAYSSVRIILEQLSSNRQQMLWIKFDPADGARQILPSPPGWSMGEDYGVVQPGDYVVIDETRQVFVNGELRNPQ